MKQIGNIFLQVDIKQISFKQILPVWSGKLWPERKSDIEPVSAIDQNGFIDMTILKFEPIFWGAYFKHELVGVISTHPTETDMYRLRGVFVEEKYRSHRVGKKLVDTVAKYAEAKKAIALWTLARKANKNFYEHCGFSIGKEINTYEFGPHYLMKKTSPEIMPVQS